MLDVPVVAESKVTETAAVTRAQVSANPVVVEFVEVGAGAEADTTRARRRRREQLVASGRVERDVVVVRSRSCRGNTAPANYPVEKPWSDEPGAAFVVLP